MESVFVTKKRLRHVVEHGTRTSYPFVPPFFRSNRDVHCWNRSPYFMGLCWNLVPVFIRVGETRLVPLSRCVTEKPRPSSSFVTIFSRIRPISTSPTLPRPPPLRSRIYGELLQTPIVFHRAPDLGVRAGLPRFATFCRVPGTALSDQFFGPPLAVVVSGHEQPVPIFQQLARSDPSGRDDVRQVPAVAAERRGSPGRAGDRHQP